MTWDPTIWEKAKKMRLRTLYEDMASSMQSEDTFDPNDTDFEKWKKQQTRVVNDFVEDCTCFESDDDTDSEDTGGREFMKNPHIDHQKMVQFCAEWTHGTSKKFTMDTEEALEYDIANLVTKHNALFGIGIFCWTCLHCENEYAYHFDVNKVSSLTINHECKIQSYKINLENLEETLSNFNVDEVDFLLKQ